MKQLGIHILAILLFVSNISMAQSTLNVAKLDSLFNSLEANSRAMGSIAIRQEGKLVYQKSIGFSNNDGIQRTIANDSTKYRVGSITKTFTATMIMQLIEAGKLSLTTTLDKFFPNIPNASSITIQNMLQHRSGIMSITEDPTYGEWMSESKTPTELVSKIASYPSKFKPDTQTAYSNSNYILLGIIIETIEKQVYNVVLQKNICDKIGLKKTYYGGKSNPDAGESYSYIYEFGWNITDETNLSIPHGAGAILSTPSELTTFIEALLTEKLVSKASIDQMRMLKDGYGLGLFEMPFYNQKSFGHNGSIDGFESAVSYFPNEKVSIAYLSNAVSFPFNDVMLGVLSIYFNKPYTIPSFTRLYLKKEELQQFVGEYKNPELPFSISVTLDNMVLYAQATGQGEFPLEAVSKTSFEQTAAGIKIDFDIEKKTLNLKQSDWNLIFTKQ